MKGNMVVLFMWDTAGSIVYWGHRTGTVYGYPSAVITVYGQQLMWGLWNSQPRPQPYHRKEEEGRELRGRNKY